MAFTIELDNEFERRLRDSGHTPRVTSFVMWANFMRFVGDGISVAELPDATGIPRARTLSTLGGMERWRYVTVGPDPETRRDGFGSARGLHPDWVVRPTPAGLAAAAIWRPLADEIEERWAERFGAAAIGELRLCLQPIARRPELALPESMPIVGGSSWTLADTVSGGTQGDASRAPLSTLLSRALLAYTLEFEAAAELALPLSANVVRVLDEKGVNVKDVALRGGISKEAVAMATTFLAKNGYVIVEEKLDPPDGARQRGADARRAGARRDRCALGHTRHPARRRRSPTCSTGRICSRWLYDRTRAVGAAASRTSRRRRPGSRIQPGRCRTTRWCCTAAAGRTGASA